MATQKIVSRWNSDKVLFECELPNGVASGLAMRHALEKATKERADLSGADLSGADLSGADLRGAYLRGAYLRGADLSGAHLSGADLSDAERANDEQAIANLDKVRAIVLDDAKRLEMDHWHDQASDWKNKSCAEEMLCGTTHCLAGWLQVCSTDPKVRALDAQTAGIVSAPVAAKMFFREGAEVIDWLTERKYVTDIEESNRRAAERKANREAGSAA